ncbi:response regulator transcription factor [Brachybacterium huguangmaarense]
MIAQSPRVLGVDDNTVLRGVLADYLRHDGFAVDVAGTGPEALEIALGTGAAPDPGTAAGTGASGPDLILLDLSLPGLDGLEVFRCLRAAGRTTPVIMLTARAAGARDGVRRLPDGCEVHLTIAR